MATSPRPPWALLRLLEEGFFDQRCTWFLSPLLNPTGFLKSTRENFAVVDLNRDYKSLQAAETIAHVAWLQHQPRCDLVICAHEDWEAQGFYLYELNLGGHPTLAPAMIEVARASSPIEAPGSSVRNLTRTEPTLSRYHHSRTPPL